MYKDIIKDKCLVGYGIGQYYEYTKARIPADIKFCYLCDRNYQSYGKEYDGIKVCSPEQLGSLDNVLVIIFSGNAHNYASICADLNRFGVSYIHINQICHLEYSITGRQLKEFNLSGYYCDDIGNEIFFSEDIEDTIRIFFQVGNNKVHIGKNVKAGNLNINCGVNSKVYIGDDSDFVSSDIVVSGGKIIIGNSCLFSCDILLRNHDYHHIFDRKTGKRINYPKDIVIGNHVWIGNRAMLLSGCVIGDNSIVGAGSITSSQFPQNVIIAGSPARIIREDIIWSTDNDVFFDWDDYSQCIDN